MFYIQKTNNKQQQIQRKISSLTLMAIMVAGGMTFAVPGMVPEAYAANANLFVSAENSNFDNYMSGPQVIEVAIIDSSISDTDEGKGEPDVTVNGNQLRMVQATDGNWYGYFADYTMATDANNAKGGMSFGEGPVTDPKLIFGSDTTEKISADGFFYNEDVNGESNVNVVREPKSVNENIRTALGKGGQIEIVVDKWPFIQLYTLSQGGNVVVQYNKGGGAQSTTLTFDTVDDYAGIELDRTSYPRGAHVHATITDAWLNIDPTDEDSWTFATNEDGSGTATYYHVYNDNGEIGDNTSFVKDGNNYTVESVPVGDLMCEDCVLKLNPNVQNAATEVITIQANKDSGIANFGNPATAGTANAWYAKNVAITTLGEGTQPVTITEQGPNSGIFGTYDESDDSLLRILDNAARGTSATIDYNDSPVTVLVTHAFATIDIQPASDVWNSGEEIPVVLVDADVNKNSRADEDMTLSNPDVPLIPSLSTGSPITLGSGVNDDGNITVNSTYSVPVNAFSDRAVLNITNSDGVKALLIDLGITGAVLKDSLIDTNANNYGYNLFNYDIRSLVEKDSEGKEDDSLGTVKITLVNATNGVEINVPLACDKSDRQGLELLPAKECDLPKSTNTTPSNGGTTTPVDTTPTTPAPEPIVIPLLYKSGDAYEMQHFGTAFDKAVSDFNATQTSKAFSSQKLDVETTPIQSVLATGAEGAVGTYTSEQLRKLNDTGKVGTGVGDIVMLSYSSAAQSFAEPDDGIFRLTTDTSRQVASIVTQLIPTNDFDNVISIHLNDAWSQDYVAALEATYGASHETIAYNTSAADITAEFKRVLTTGNGFTGLDAQTAIVILEYNHDRLDTLIEELARKDGNSNAYAGISTTKFIIPDVPSGAFGAALSASANTLLKDTDMKTIKFALSDNTQGQTELKNALLAQIPNREVKLDGDELFDRHAYAAYDAGQILTRAINTLGTEYTSAELNAAIPTAAAAYSSGALIYNTVLNANGDLECMVYDIFEIDDDSSGFVLQEPTQQTTDATNCMTDPTRTVPNAPTTLTANHRDGEAALEWVASPTATSYKVQYKLATATSWTDGPTTTGTTAMVTGLTNGQEYTFRVIATNTVGDSVASDIATATPSVAKNPPGVPTVLTATSVNATAVSLTWTAPTDDGGESITDYKVEYRTITERTWTTFDDGDKSTTGAIVTGLTINTQYQFQVSATNTQGTGAVSNIAVATPEPAPTVPGAPTGLTATAGDTTVALSWTAPSTGDAPTSYKVQQSTDGSTFTDSTPSTSTGTTVTVTGLTNDQAYTFRVFATNTVGDSVAASNAVQATPTAPSTGGTSNTAPVIQPITAQTFTVGTALSVPINATDADGDTLSYTVTLSPNPNTNPTAQGNELTWPVPEAGTYDVMITVRDRTTNGNTVSFTLTINTPPVVQPITTAPTTATEGEEVSFTVTATDADPGDNPTITPINPQGLTSTPTFIAGVFTWTPNAADVGKDIVFMFGATDGKDQSAQVSVTITVSAAQTTFPDRADFDANVNVPILLDKSNTYEVSHFERAFMYGVDMFDESTTDKKQSQISFAAQSVDYKGGANNITAGIDMVLNNHDAHGAVGTYTSEQLMELNNTGKIGTGADEIVLLSYASTASSFAVPDDGIFRLTVDNSRQVTELITKLILDAEYDQVITIHRNDTWSKDYVTALDTAYGNKHKDIPYNTDIIFGGELNTILNNTDGLPATLDSSTAIVILEFDLVAIENLIIELAMRVGDDGAYLYTGINETQFIIPDVPDEAFDTTDGEFHPDDLLLLAETNMKTIKFALSGNDLPNMALFEDAADRHVYAAYDAGQILARAIDALGKDHTSATLADMIPLIAANYSSSALIHNTILNDDGDLDCMTYDIFEVNDNATTYELQDPTQLSTKDNCASSQSVDVFNSPQLVSCIDCAINSFGEIFGQTVQVAHQANHTTITDILQIHDDSELAILIEYQNPVTTDSEDDPIVLDFFAFGFGDERVANQIVRLELEESGDNTSTFEGGLEYVMLNQLNILDADTYTGLDTISDVPTFIVMEDLTDEDSPRVNYLDLGADGVSTQIADQQEAPSHSGVVALDSDNYKVADTVIITLTDADLNVDSELIDIFTVVKNGTLADTVGEDVSKSYSASIGANKTITESGAPLGRVLDVTFDDEIWADPQVANSDNVSCKVADKDGKFDGAFNRGLGDTGLTLIETETASGVFTGSFQIPDVYCKRSGNTGDNGKVASVTGTDIEVNYLDYRDASGEIIEVGDSAGVRASTGSIALDRTVYPVPFGNDTFRLHASAGDGEYLPKGDVSIHVRVSDPDYDISASGEDTITEGATGPVKVTVSRGSDSKVVATAGGESVIEATNTTAKEYGPITEIAPDAGIFEADITISSTDGPYTRECPDSNGCVLQGDIITVQYNDPTDASGEPNTVTDSATFDLRNAVLQSDKSVYIIGSDMILTLIEPDFDLDSDGAETYSLDLIEWDSDAASTSMGPLGGDNAAAFDPEPSAFRETGDSTGIFQVVIEIPESLDNDKLERGEEIELEYTDWGPSGSNYVGEEDEDIGLTVFTSNFGSTVELDQKVYTWTDKVYITIVAPDHNFDSDLVDEIGNSDDDPIRIATRSADLDNYKLVETGTDTGIFTGEVILTGFAHDANGDGETDDARAITGDGNDKIKGLGPTNGFLETEDDDGLSVSFEFSEDETVIASSLIRWNIGEVQWLEASYAASGTGLVRVVDPDMNLNPESVDNFEIDIWSDTHAGGIDLTVTETNQATGIFEGTVFFTVTDESSGHRLRVSEGDTVTAEYEDRTLPDPHDTSDKIDITATTQIGSIIPPLERAPATNLRIVDAFSNTLDTLDVDQQVQITADLANGQDKDQPFAYIVQIQDSSSVTVALAWVSGTLTPSQSFSPALSWTPSEAGTYTATAFVWESVDNPTALSPPSELTITVN